MSDFYTCEARGETYHRQSNHQSVCPGSPDDRISALEERVADLEERLSRIEARAVGDEIEIASAPEPG